MAIVVAGCATTAASTPVTGGDMRILDSERECERTAEPELLNARMVAQAIHREFSQLLGPGRMEEDRRILQTALYLFIDETGTVTESLVQTGSGSAPFDQVVIRVSRTARFRPAMCDDEPVAVRISLAFTLSRR